MRALLLAAGLGTRLRPLTEKTPKCLALIKGRPLLEIWLEKLSQASIGPFLINTHHLSSQVENFAKASPYRDQITLVNEVNLKGTAGTLISNINFFLNEDALLIHADNYCLADFNEFKNAHERRPAECLMTMMTFRTNDPSSCGIVQLDENGVVVDFYEKVENPPGNLANGAAYILSAELVSMLSTDFQGITDFSTEVISQFLGRIYTYQTNEVLIDIGTPASYERANRQVVE